MKKDSKICARLLTFHHNGFSVASAYKTNWKQHLFRACLFLCLLFFTVVLQHSQLHFLYVFGAGMMFGAIIQDLGYIMKTKQLWPLNERIIDWNIVKDIAKSDK